MISNRSIDQFFLSFPNHVDFFSSVPFCLILLFSGGKMLGHRRRTQTVSLLLAWQTPPTMVEAAPYRKVEPLCWLRLRLRPNSYQEYPNSLIDQSPAQSRQKFMGLVHTKSRIVSASATPDSKLIVTSLFSNRS